MPKVQPVQVEIAPGELIDKITILQIKSERIREPAKLDNVRRELNVLIRVREAAIPASPELSEWTEQLKAVNVALWEIEDGIRDCEREQDFGPRFIDLARSVYRHNDRRSELKRHINQLLDSRIVEEKSYRPY